MNSIAVSIYNVATGGDLLSTAIQLAITNQIVDLVYTNFSDARRAIGSAWVTNAGDIQYDADVEQLLDSSLLYSIRNWNRKRTSHTIKLDPTTIRLASQIELDYTHPSGDRSLTQAKIATLITTECSRSVIKDRQLLASDIHAMFDSVSGDAVYLGNSTIGTDIHDRIIKSIQHNDTGCPDIYIIQAPQGAGKTRFLNVLVEDVYLANKRTTSLSPRQQLTSSSYHSIMKIKTIDKNKVLVGASSVRRTTQQYQRPADEYNITLTTINSLERIWNFADERLRQLDRLYECVMRDHLNEEQYNKKKALLDANSADGNIFKLLPEQHLLVYDEFLLLRSNLLSGTHIRHAEADTIRRYMKHLESEARAILILDADIDASVIEYFKLNHPDSNIFMYKCVVPERRMVHLHNDGDSLKCWFLQQIKELDAKPADVKSPAKFAIPCTSAKEGRELAQLIRNMRPDLKVMWIEARNKSDSEQKALLKDPSLACEYDVIMYSPTIFTGFSFDPVNIDGKWVPVADHVIGMFGDSKIGWVDRAQALFRVRNCLEFHFSITDTHPPIAHHVGTTTDDMEDCDDGEDEIVVDDKFIQRRTWMFNCEGMHVPIPHITHANDNMILHFRSRGFSLVDMPAIEGVEQLLSELKEFRLNNTDVVPSARTLVARQLVDLLLPHFNIDRSTMSNCNLYTGSLAGGFSCVMDEICKSDAFIEGVMKLLPHWKRNPRFDMINIQKVVELASMGLEIQINQTKTTRYGKRQNIFHLNLVVHQPNPM